MSLCLDTVPVGTRALSVPAARRLALLGGVLAFGFAAVHAYWAAGGRWGVPAGVAPIGGRPWFLAYDLAAGVALVLAGVIGVLLAAPAGGGRHRALLVRVALVGSVLALLRGGPGLVMDAVAAVQGTGVTALGLAVDVWFVVAGLLFLVVARRLRVTAQVVSGRRR